MRKALADVSELPPVADTDPVLIQSRLLDAQMQSLAKSYQGKWVVFYDGRVLGSGATIEEAISHIRDDERDLPFVIDRVDADAGPIDMGGPKEAY